MRFAALLKKELRECLPWLLPAGVLLFAIGALALRAASVNEMSDIQSRSYQLTAGSSVKQFWLTVHPPLSGVAGWLTFISIGLGLALGIRQFWIPGFKRQWDFLLHRSVRRQTVLWAKLIAAAMAFAVSVGLIWIIFYWYSCRPGVFAAPMALRFLFEGLVWVLFGYIVYLGAALSGLSRARWYTSKLFGAGLAFFAFLLIICQWQLVWAFAAIGLAAAVLLSQIIWTFLNVEFQAGE